MAVQPGQRFPAKEHARKVIKELLESVKTSDGEVCYGNDSASQGQWLMHYPERDSCTRISSIDER